MTDVQGALERHWSGGGWDTSFGSSGVMKPRGAVPGQALPPPLHRNLNWRFTVLSADKLAALTSNGWRARNSRRPLFVGLSPPRLSVS